MFNSHRIWSSGTWKSISYPFYSIFCSVSELFLSCSLLAPGKTLRVSYLLPVMFFICGCHSISITLEAPNLLQEKKIDLGTDKRDVVQRLGNPHKQINLSKLGHLVSIFEYDSHQIDYNPGYERDDYSSPIYSSPGFKERYRRDYRMVFIDNRLYSIEDFCRNRYSVLPPDDLKVEMILNKLREIR